MSDDFEYISHARLEYRNGYRHAYLGEVAELVIYGVQGVLPSTTEPKKGRRSRRLSTISLQQSPAECTAHCVAPWQGVRSTSITTPSKLQSTSAAIISALFPNDAKLFISMANDAGTSTFDAGIHTQLDLSEGLTLGTQVGQKVAARALADSAN